jgi:hypothetical protein
MCLIMVHMILLLGECVFLAVELIKPKSDVLKKKTDLFRILPA